MKDLKDKFNEIFKKELTDLEKERVAELQAEYLKAVALEDISKIEIVNGIISELSFSVENLDKELLEQTVRNNENMLEREHLTAKKVVYLDILNKFSIPNIDWIEEELQTYDDK